MNIFGIPLKTALIVTGSAIAVGAVSSGLIYINNSAYERGGLKAEQRAMEQIERIRREVATEREKTKKMSDDALDLWFYEQCIKSGRTPEQCQ